MYRKSRWIRIDESIEVKDVIIKKFFVLLLNINDKDEVIYIGNKPICMKEITKPERSLTLSHPLNPIKNIKDNVIESLVHKVK